MSLLLRCVFAGLLSLTGATFVTATTPPRVIVVGAGFAGLGAATTLQAAGANVTILEARDRVGGRAFTDKTTFGFPVDMGAMWIHGIQNNPVYKLAQKYGVQTKYTDYENLNYFSPSGEIVPVLPLNRSWNELTPVIDRIRNNPKLNQDLSLEKAMEEAFEELNYNQSLRDLMRFKICDEVELDYGASIKNLSGWWYDADAYLMGGDHLINDTRGYSAIVEPVAADLTNPVVTNVTVVEISYSDENNDFVKVTALDGRVFRADYVVVTASLGTLKRDMIRFKPRLPHRLRKAISRLGCGVSDKLVLQFADGAEKSWGGKKLDVFYHIGKEPSQHGAFTENWNIAHYNGRPMLDSFSVGAQDWKLEEDVPSDKEVTKSAMAALHTAYPSMPDPIRAHLHRWGDDPLASCTWSSWYVGSSPKDTKEFLKGTGGGRLLFAGEHATHIHPGTTHGAWNTGVSAASAILVARKNSGGKLNASDALKLRERIHIPDPKDVLHVPFLHSKRRQWGRLLKQQRGVTEEHQ